MYFSMVLKKLFDKFLETLKEYRRLSKGNQEKGSVSQHFQDLFNLCIAAGTGSKGQVICYIRKALASAVTTEEITHSVLLCLTIMGFPNRIATLCWINEILQKEFEEKIGS